MRHRSYKQKSAVMLFQPQAPENDAKIASTDLVLCIQPNKAPFSSAADFSAAIAQMSTPKTAFAVTSAIE